MQNVLFTDISQINSLYIWTKWTTNKFILPVMFMPENKSCFYKQFVYLQMGILKEIFLLVLILNVLYLFSVS